METMRIFESSQYNAGYLPHPDVCGDWWHQLTAFSSSLKCTYGVSIKQQKYFRIVGLSFYLYLFLIT